MMTKPLVSYSAVEIPSFVTLQILKTPVEMICVKPQLSLTCLHLLVSLSLSVFEKPQIFKNKL